jgi:hypothetical protein
MVATLGKKAIGEQVLIGATICPISASKNHFEGFRYADHTFNLLEFLRRKDNGKISSIT